MKLKGENMWFRIFYSSLFYTFLLHCLLMPWSVLASMPIESNRGLSEATLDISSERLESLHQSIPSSSREFMVLYGQFIPDTHSRRDVLFEDLSDEYHMKRYFDFKIKIPKKVKDALKNVNTEIKLEDFSFRNIFPGGIKGIPKFTFYKIVKTAFPGHVFKLEYISKVVFWQHITYSGKQVFMIEFFFNDNSKYNELTKDFLAKYGKGKDWSMGRRFFYTRASYWEAEDLSFRSIYIEHHLRRPIEREISIALIDSVRMRGVVNYINTIYQLSPSAVRGSSHKESNLKIEFIGINRNLSWHKLQEKDPFRLEDRRYPFYYIPFSISDLIYLAHKNGCICDCSDEFKKQIHRFGGSANLLFQRGSSSDHFENEFPVKLIKECSLEMPRIHDWIKSNIKRDKRLKYTPYLDSLEKFRTLNTRRPDIFNELYTEEFLVNLKINNPRMFRQWIMCCFGLTDPVFSIKLRYDGDKSTRLVKVVYEVLHTDHIMGGGGILDLPIVQYIHELEYKEGITEKILEPNIIINASRNGTLFSFDIMLKPKFSPSLRDKVGRVWLFSMSFHTSDGEVVSSRPMAVVMSRFN